MCAFVAGVILDMRAVYFRMTDATHGKGFGQMATAGYVDPYWVAVNVELTDGDSFVVSEDDSVPVPGNRNNWGSSTFHRWYKTCPVDGAGLKEVVGAH